MGKASIFNNNIGSANAYRLHHPAQGALIWILKYPKNNVNWDLPPVAYEDEGRPIVGVTEFFILG